MSRRAAPLLIVKTGCTLAPIRERRGDFEGWICAGLEFEASEVDVASVYEGDELPRPESVSGVVVTGSSALVSEREDWSERAAKWLSQAVDCDVPLLGICYGHQLLAHARGGRVERNPLGREIGTVELTFAPGYESDALFAGFAREISVQVSHVESVTELPREARRLGTSPGDPHQVFAVGSSAWGVQFHPEFDADIVRGYIEGRRDRLVEEGLDPEALTARAKDSEHGSRVLRRFGALVRERAARD